MQATLRARSPRSAASAPISASRSAARDAAAFADRLMYRCLAKGLSFKIGGGKVVTLCPPLTIGLDDFDLGLRHARRGAADELGG